MASGEERLMLAVLEDAVEYSRSTCWHEILVEAAISGSRGLVLR
jgi:hypothetical protein